MGKRYEALHEGGWVAKTSKKKRDILYGRPLTMSRCVRNVWFGALRYVKLIDLIELTITITPCLIVNIGFMTPTV